MIKTLFKHSNRTLLWVRSQSSTYGCVDHSFFTTTTFFIMCKIHFKRLIAPVFAMAFTSVQPFHYCRGEVKIINCLSAHRIEYVRILLNILHLKCSKWKTFSFACTSVHCWSATHTKININPHSHKHTKTTQLTKVFRQQYTFFL